MATITPTTRDVGPSGDGSIMLVTWPAVTAADTCAPVSFPAMADKSVQAAGTFDSGSVAVHGSNDGSNYAALRNPASNVIAITTAGINAVLENTVFVQPVISGGGGSQSLTISMLFRMLNTLRQ